jgi:TfoX/Sxy family transcriptional regulator of competence genes
MAYDLDLADRIRRVVGKRPGVTEKEMFGGVCFLSKGKMFIGIVKDDLMVRVGPEHHESALSEPHVRPMDFTGRPMKGYVYVGPDGTGTAAEVASWVDRAASFVATLGEPKKRRAKRRG